MGIELDDHGEEEEQRAEEEEGEGGDEKIEGRFSVMSRAGNRTMDDGHAGEIAEVMELGAEGHAVVKIGMTRTPRPHSRASEMACITVGRCWAQMMTSSTKWARQRF